MPDNSNKDTRKNLFRPIILAVLVGASLFLSVVFLLSPDASSRYSNPVITAPSIDVVKESASVNVPEQKPKTARYDFRLSGSNTFYNVLSVLNVPGTEIQMIAKKARPIYDLKQLKKDEVLRVYTLEDKLDKIEYKFNEYSVLLIERAPNEAGGFKATKSELPHEVKEIRVAGTIENSLYEDGIKAGGDPQAIMALSDIFAWDVDFASDIQRGDKFSILYDVLYVEGRPVRMTGRIQGAEMVNNGKKYSAFYYKGAEGDGYYDADGKSLRRTLLKSPLRFRRITSYFTNSRFHPILKRYRPHHGIDYAAPTGTPIESAGSGRVAFAGWKNGYGNFIEIKHNNNYTTAYGHLSRIAKGVRTGSKISQGDVIGFVGSTGISTGPHLHYEVRLGKALVNPLSIKAIADISLSKKEKQKFVSLRDEISKKLSSVALASASAAPDARPVNGSKNSASIN